MNVTRGALSAACARGCTSIEALADATRASTLCGSCRPLLAELVGIEAVPVTPMRGSTGMRIASMVVVAFCIAMLAVRGLPLSDSIQTESVLDLLFRSSLSRQVTGYTLAGLALIGTLLSLRKRVKRFAGSKWAGNYGLWRAAHAILGTAAVAILIAHTGMRLGSNLNLALMICFLGVNVAGAAAAFLVASNSSRWSFWLHLATVWPLPVLLGFHIVSAYYF
jgi:nitrite reductase (NADH) large subunit